MSFVVRAGVQSSKLLFAKTKIRYSIKWSSNAFMAFVLSACSALSLESEAGSKSRLTPPSLENLSYKKSEASKSEEAKSSSRRKVDLFVTNQAASVLSYGETFTYQAYVPKNYNERESIPLVVFLHGAGERIGGYRSATSVGMGVAIRKNPALFSAIVIFPHCPENEWWSTTTCHDSFLSVLQDAQHRYTKIDPKRQYLTGLSMGGYGVLVYGERYHGQWAAFLPVAPRSTAGGGFPSPLDVASGRFEDKERYYRIAKVFEQDPIWFVHGDIDPVVPVSESRNIAYHLQQLGNDRAKYLELKGRGHDIWDDVYQDEGMIDWLLGQSK